MQLGERGGGGQSSTPLCTGDHVPVPDEKLDIERRPRVGGGAKCMLPMLQTSKLKYIAVSAGEGGKTPGAYPAGQERGRRC